ncbi:MAG: galactose-1-phosphate uridylyltransferase [Dehalococcoidales bacterium]|nr:galactose-1-phosphate uridylyltransferase [Dehalococcoidales bacterium]
MSEMRWDPVLEEWVITATNRHNRTFLPPKDYCPLCPTIPGVAPTEVPSADCEIAVFENKFPSMRAVPPIPVVEGTDVYRVKPAQGLCEVVLYSARHEGSLTDLSVAQITRLIYVWADRYEELGSLDFVDYVFIFENKGEVIGVTVPHPHGQIYAFPFIPPRIQRELEAGRRYVERTGRCLFCDIVREEMADGRRLVAHSESFVAFVPFSAHYPYELHVYARDHKLSLNDFDSRQRIDLARILKVVLTKFDNLWGFPFPYVMVMHQKPTDGGSHDSYHFHIEFYPPHRARDKLKYPAGTEVGGGVFVNDTLPEEKAEELRQVEPRS